jgi:hypothetical protein
VTRVETDGRSVDEVVAEIAALALRTWGEESVSAPGTGDR